MKLSIITVCLNSEVTITDTILSVLAQKSVDYEYIVFDGGSTDKTVALIQSFGDRVKLVQGADSGIFDAMNQAIQLASGDVIGILNSDDFYAHDEVLSKVMRVFEDTNTDSVYGDLVYVQRDNPGRIWRVWKSGAFKKSKFKAGWCPPHPTFFVCKQAYENFGFFNTSFRISGDYELMLRFLYKYDVSTVYLPEVLVKMRTGGNSAGKAFSKLRSVSEDVHAWQINELKPTVLTLPLKILSKVPQFFHGSKK